MDRLKEVTGLLDTLGIDYQLVDTGDVTFKYGKSEYWFHPEESDPNVITINCFGIYGMKLRLPPTIYSIINELNMIVPAIKAFIIDGCILLNCDMYKGKHRLCPYDMTYLLERMETAVNLLREMIDPSLC